jgi:hypothetical protein
MIAKANSLTPITVPQSGSFVQVAQSFELSNLGNIANALTSQLEIQQRAEKQTLETALKTGLFLCQVRDNCARGTLEALLKLLGSYRRTARSNMQLASRFLDDNTEAKALAIEAGKSLAGGEQLELFGDGEDSWLPEQVQTTLQDWLRGKTRRDLLQKSADAEAEAEAEDAVEVTTTPVSRGKRSDGTDPVRKWELDQANAQEAWQPVAGWLEGALWEHLPLETLRLAVSTLEAKLPSIAEALATRAAEEAKPARKGGKRA